MKNSLEMTLIFLIFFFSLGAYAQAPDPVLNKFIRLRTDPGLQRELQGIVEWAAQSAFGAKPAEPVPVSDFFEEALPIFVTLEKKGEVRGCMGTLAPRRQNMAQEIGENLRRALFQDPWHREVGIVELPGMTVYLTAVGRPQAVKGIGEISPGRDGAYLRSGSREAVALPGEAKTQRYLLSFLKAKAGIKKDAPFQIFRLPTATVAVTLP